MENVSFKENRLNLFLTLFLFSLIFVFMTVLDSWIIYRNSQTLELSPLFFFVIICNSLGIYSLFRSYLTLILTSEGILYSSFSKKGFIKYESIKTFDLWHIRNRGINTTLHLANILAKNTKNFDRKHIYIQSDSGESIDIDTALIPLDSSQLTYKDCRADFISIVEERSKRKLTVNKTHNSTKFHLKRLLIIFIASLAIAFTYRAIFDVWSIIFT